jgi:hypothetical protein
MAKEKNEDLSDALSHLLEECRMVLPGIQALFGFQLIAFFNQRFETLAATEKWLHLVATFLIAMSAGLVMTPAALHRQRSSSISWRLVTLSTRLLLGSMTFLAVGVTLDFFIIAAMVVEKCTVSAATAGLLFVILIFLWFIFPHLTETKSDV